MLYLWKMNTRKFVKDKNRNIDIKKSEIIVIIQISIETQHIVFVI